MEAEWEGHQHRRRNDHLYMLRVALGWRREGVHGAPEVGVGVGISVEAHPQLRKELLHRFARAILLSAEEQDMLKIVS